MSRAKLPRARPRMSEAQFLAYKERMANGGLSAIVLQPAKGSKYGNKKVVHEGITFDSGRELKWWLACVQDQADGKIRDLKRQVPFILAEKANLGEKRVKPALRYRADIVFTDTTTGRQRVLDAKGMSTPEYRIKKHLMFTVHGILIEEV